MKIDEECDQKIERLQLVWIDWILDRIRRWVMMELREYADRPERI
jgi:hypothetical protein